MQNTAIVTFCYTQTPNYFLDVIAPQLTASELRVMLYVYRHLLGYQKLSDWISYEQFLNGVITNDNKRLDNGAGVSRRSLVVALDKLERRKLITRHQRGISLTELALNAPEPEPAEPANEPPPPEPAPSDSEQVQKLHLNHAEQVQKLHHTKENQNQNKTVVAVAVNLLVQFGFGRNEANRLTLVLVQNGRDIAYLERLIKYVTTAPNVQNRHALLTTLVRTNAERTAEPPRRAGAERHQRQTNAPSSIDWSKYAPGGKYAYLVQ
ncbi:hypothetical protein [Candidatus Chlorohelix sp.]|uniref:hypothetical protein n=1 Tax=Candidatus Chlorohelix sp. TaxID=3139201 RepID=UPI00305C4F0B